MPPATPTTSRARVWPRLLRGLLWTAATCLLLAALGALVVLGIVLSADSSSRWMPDPIAAWAPGPSGGAPRRPPEDTGTWRGAPPYSPSERPRISFMISSVPPPIGPSRASRAIRSMPCSAM
jgi:hypothetical protein